MGVHRVGPHVRGAGWAAVPAARGTASCVLTLAAILTVALVALPGSPAAARTARPASSARLAGAVPAHGTLYITPSQLNPDCDPQMNCVDYPAADVLNVTVAQPQAAGFLTVYPGNGQPPNSSNVNFKAGQMVANLVTVQQYQGDVAIYNGSSGSVQIAVDQEGYFVDPY
jgi:hypothetical protein